jgi:hypothetical protein
MMMHGLANFKHGIIISICSGDKNAYKIISTEYEWKK